MRNVSMALIALTLLTFGMAQGAIPDVLRSDDRFETLVAALATTDLLETLAGEGPYTLLAPTDRAFNRIDGLQELLDEPETLRRILLLHVVPGRVAAARAAALEPLATALEGQSLTVRVVEGTLYVGDAIVTITDIEASNGVIHAIDTVLTPPVD